ncbi:uncharacterized protein PSFLO_07425 [Pseudozyma flocculosa]|nr:uncharacterized protein PSFLO_07425 [Pseudozyma flocculosa]
MIQCHLCPKRYARHEHLKRHIQSSHESSRPGEGPRSFACDVPGCDKVYRRSDVLARHKAGHSRPRPDSDSPESPANKRQRHSDHHPAASGPDHRSSSISSSIGSAHGHPSDQHSGAPEAGGQLAARQYQEGAANHQDTPAHAPFALPSTPSEPLFVHQRPSQVAMSPGYEGPNGANPSPLAYPRQQHPQQQQHHHHHQALQASVIDVAGPGLHRPQGQPVPLQPAAAAAALPPTFTDFCTAGFGQPDVASATGPPMYDFAAASTSAGPSFGWDALDYGNLTALDWILDDIRGDGAASVAGASTLSGVQASNFGDDDEGAPPLDDFGPTPPAGFNVFGPTPAAGTDPTESLNLLNLANTAISTALPASGAAATPAPGANGNGASTARAGRSDDEEGEWPQEYRPMRSKPPTIEISDYLLDVEVEPEAAEGRGAKTAAKPARTRGPYIPFVLIDDDSPEGPPGRSTSHGIASASPLSASTQSPSLPSWPDAAAPSATLLPPPGRRVDAQTRLKLLDYLRHACRHPWSLYSFATAPDGFLTCVQLETLVSLYFRKFHPYLPILHPASFDCSTASPVLLLILVTVGLVFYATEMQARGGLPASVARLRKRTSVLAPAFSELARIGIMSAFEADQRGFQDVGINTAWVIQQTFGVGSGDKRLYKLAERNRGGMVTAIRRLGVLNMPDVRLDFGGAGAAPPLDDHLLERSWRAWIERERRIRLGWFVFLYDQMFSCFLDISPMLLYTEVTSPFPCDEPLWNAATPHEWYRRILGRSEGQRAPKPSFTASLEQLLDPRRGRAAAATATATAAASTPPLRLNRLEAYILAVTLYRIRWDSSKRSVLFGSEGFAFADEARFAASPGGRTCDGVDTDDDDDAVGRPRGSRRARQPARMVTIDGAASNALQGLAEAASWATLSLTSSGLARTPSGSPSLALSIDVQLLRLLSKLHFTGSPAFFDKLKDAAGRSGMTSARRAEAIQALERWMGDPNHQVAMRTMLLTSAQVYHLIRTSLDASATKPDVLVLQSNVCTVSLFHAALVMWACSKFATPPPQPQNGAAGDVGDGPAAPSDGGHDRRCDRVEQRQPSREDDGGDGDDDDDEAIRLYASRHDLPCLSPSRTRALEGIGVLDLVGSGSSSAGLSPDDWQDRSGPDEGGAGDGAGGADAMGHARAIEAWVHGAYISSADGTPRRWAAAQSLAVRVPGIGELLGPPQSAMSSRRGSIAPSTAEGLFGLSLSSSPSPSSSAAATAAAAAAVAVAARAVESDRLVKASRILQRFASLLRKLDWGLAASFRTILLHMARYEARTGAAAGSSSSGGGGGGRGAAG